jgi:hypothetical protein
MTNKKHIITDKKVNIGCGVVTVICIVIIFFLFKSCGGTSDNSKEEKHQDDSIFFYENATILAQRVIKEQLYCPSKADFQSFQVICFSDSAKGDTVRVIATFDAQNMYGAMIRDKMAVDERITGDYHNSGNWESIRCMTMKELNRLTIKEMDEAEKKPSKLKYKEE